LPIKKRGLRRAVFPAAEQRQQFRRAKQLQQKCPLHAVEQFGRVARADLALRLIEDRSRPLATVAEMLGSPRKA
jgi:hypothetical protein